MRTKMIRLCVESKLDFNKRIGRHMNQLDKGVRKKLADETLSVESISDFKKILTPKRMEILAKIRDCKPSSIYELAKMLDRKQENVQSDVSFLTNLGLIDVRKSKKGRKRTILNVNYDTIDLRVPLVASVCLK